MEEVARIDKWLWAARIFKTRSIAADACKNGRVTIGGVNVKPSHIVKVGETVDVRKPPITYSFRIADSSTVPVAQVARRRKTVGHWMTF